MYLCWSSTYRFRWKQQTNLNFETCIYKNNPCNAYTNDQHTSNVLITICSDWFNFNPLFQSETYSFLSYEETLKCPPCIPHNHLLSGQKILHEDWGRNPLSGIWHWVRRLDDYVVFACICTPHWINSDFRWTFWGSFDVQALD